MGNLLVRTKFSDQLSKFKKQNWVWLIILFMISFAVRVSRDPTAFFHPQFWAEDGKYWYAQAYNNGPFSSLFIPYANSLQIAIRMVASVSLLFPLSMAPTVFVYIAGIIQIAPVILINTKRFRTLIPNTYARLFTCFLYISLPNSFEINANVTNINWHLALLACMVLIASVPKKTGWKIFDALTIVLCGFTGPFAIVLSGIAGIRYYLLDVKERRLYRLHLSLIVACALLQIFILKFSDSSQRFDEPLGATPQLFLSLVGVRVFAALIVGLNHFSSFQYNDLVTPVFWLGTFYVAILSFVSLWKGPQHLKLFVIFCWGIFIAALLKPQASEFTPQWQSMLMGTGNRYYFLPMLAFIISSIWVIVASRHKAIKIAVCVPLAMCVVVGVPKDWRYEAKPNLYYLYYAEKFQNITSGHYYSIPINPSWSMTLHKK